MKRNKIKMDVCPKVGRGPAPKVAPGGEFVYNGKWPWAARANEVAIGAIRGRKVAGQGSGRKLLVDEELRIRPIDIDRLIELMRRSGRPQTTADLVRYYLERLRQELTRGR
jgi:hypothetical protein